MMPMGTRPGKEVPLPICARRNMLVFHDSVVLEVAFSSETLTVRLECVSVYENDVLVRQEAGALVVKGISSFSEDELPCTGPTRDFDDGQILRLYQDESGMHIVVDWENYSQRTTWASEYRVVGREYLWVPDDGPAVALDRHAVPG